MKYRGGVAQLLLKPIENKHMCFMETNCPKISYVIGSTTVLNFRSFVLVLQTEYLSIFKLSEYHYWVAESMSWRLVGQLVGG